MDSHGVDLAGRYLQPRLHAVLPVDRPSAISRRARLPQRIHAHRTKSPASIFVDRQDAPQALGRSLQPNDGQIGRKPAAKRPRKWPTCLAAWLTAGTRLVRRSRAGGAAVSDSAPAACAPAASIGRRLWLLRRAAINPRRRTIRSPTWIARRSKGSPPASIVPRPCAAMRPNPAAIRTRWRLGKSDTLGKAGSANCPATAAAAVTRSGSHTDRPGPRRPRGCPTTHQRVLRPVRVGFDQNSHPQLLGSTAQPDVFGEDAEVDMVCHGRTDACRGCDVDHQNLFVEWALTSAALATSKESGVDIRRLDVWRMQMRTVAKSTPVPLSLGGEFLAASVCRSRTAFCDARLFALLLSAHRASLSRTAAPR